MELEKSQNYQSLPYRYLPNRTDSQYYCKCNSLKISLAEGHTVLLKEQGDKGNNLLKHVLLMNKCYCFNTQDHRYDTLEQ